MKLIEKIYTWIRRNTTVCGYTLDEIDEMKRQSEREAMCREMMKEYEEMVKLCYIAALARKQFGQYGAATAHAETFMEGKYGKEWLDYIHMLDLKE